MPDNSRESLEFPLGRWLLIGLGVVVGFLVIVVVIANLADDDAPEAAGPQVEWSVDLVDQTGNTVVLKGDLPDGRPTETWVDDVQIARTPGGSFEWDMNAELPVPVVQIDDAAGCQQLNAELSVWIEALGVAVEEQTRWQARAFAQHAVDVMRDRGCDIDPTIFDGL